MIRFPAAPALVLLLPILVAGCWLDVPNLQPTEGGYAPSSEGAVGEAAAGERAAGERSAEEGTATEATQAEPARGSEADPGTRP